MKLGEFDKIVLTYQEPIYWHIRRMVVCHEDAQDILQETFLKAYNKLGQLKDPAALKSWLYRIATNEAISFLRSSKKGSQQPLEVLSTLEADPYIDYDNEALIKFQKALQLLTPQERAAFTMRYYDEMSYEQIAAILDTTVGTLKVAYHNAKNKIKEYILG